MAYREETYVIDPEVDTEKQIVQKPMESVPVNNLQREYEIIEEEVTNPTDQMLQEIHDTAVAEGLVREDEGLIGGEGAKPEEVINAIVNKPMSEGAQKNKEEYEEQQIEKHRKIVATRELLTGMTKKHINVEISAVVDVEQEDGSIAPELCDIQLTIKRLTESQSNHIFNKQMIGKKIADMNREELNEEDHIRSKYLATAVVEPKLSEEEWYNDVPSAIVYAAYEAVTEALNNIDNTSLFQ